MSDNVQTIILPQTARQKIQEKYIASEQACQLNDHGHDLAQRGLHEAALVALRRAVALEPKHPIILAGLGAMLFDTCRYEEAEKYLNQAIAIEPEYAPTWGNLGATLGGLHRYEEAHEAYKKALELEPDFSDARWNYAMSLLDSGNWTEAWKHYGSRKIRGGNYLFPLYPYPEWKGEDLNGKTLHVQGEQGLGDRILFSRYLVWIKEKYPDVKIIFQFTATDLPDVSNIMWAYRDIVEAYLPFGAAWPKADYGIFLMSIPEIHGTTVDNVYPEPGLILKDALLRKDSVSLPGVDKSMLKIGIAWTGNPAMKRNKERSIPFELIMQLASLPNVVLYAIQPGNQDIARFGADQLVCDLTQDIKPIGFMGTAITMLNLDLVITCCTVTSHLAGALNVPCWVLLCKNPYWLWLRDRMDTVWYPNTRLFRQKDMGDWAPVIDEVKYELSNFANARQSKAA